MDDLHRLGPIVWVKLCQSFFGWARISTIAMFDARVSAAFRGSDLKRLQGILWLTVCGKSPFLRGHEIIIIL